MKLVETVYPARDFSPEAREQLARDIAGMRVTDGQGGHIGKVQRAYVERDEVICVLFLDEERGDWVFALER